MSLKQLYCGPTMKYVLQIIVNCKFKVTLTPQGEYIFNIPNRTRGLCKLSINFDTLAPGYGGFSSSIHNCSSLRSALYLRKDRSTRHKKVWGTFRVDKK